MLFVCMLELSKVYRRLWLAEEVLFVTPDASHVDGLQEIHAYRHAS